MRLYRAKSLGMVHAPQPVHARVWKEMIKDVDSINVLIDRLTNKDFAVKTELTLLKGQYFQFVGGFVASFVGRWALDVGRNHM